jgi:hypothetical protein
MGSRMCQNDMEDIRMCTKFEMESLKRRDQMGNLEVDGRIILKFI